MTFLQILLTIIVAVLIGILFYYVFRKAGPWGKFWTFILVLILAGLAAAAWIPPVGPVFWDIAWIPVVFVILLFALLMAAATPPERVERETTEVPPENLPVEERASVSVLLSAFFWIFIVFLFFAAIWGIFAPVTVYY
jgi:hypothetical protein